MPFRSMPCLLRVLRAAGLAAIAFTGCSHHPGLRTPSVSTEQTVAPGVVYRAFTENSSLAGESEVYVLDVDLAEPGVRVRVVAENARPENGRVFADTYRASEWCARSGAVGGVNGGFFGQTDGVRKEVVGLLATDGVVRSSGQVVRSRRQPGQRFVRSVLGFGADGAPRIGWAVARRGRAALLTDFAAPENPAEQSYWNVTSAVACGPRLIARGKVRVFDREERLASPLAVPRTFAGYSVEGGRPRRLALCVGTAMTYAQAAAFLEGYFARYHRARCAEAMCLDGGSSSQLAYRTDAGMVEAIPTLVAVPTAIVVSTR